MFRDVGISRELGNDPSLARFHVGQYVRDEGLVERLEGAEASFWRHVREAAIATGANAL